MSLRFQFERLISRLTRHVPHVLTSPAAAAHKASVRWLSEPEMTESYLFPLTPTSSDSIFLNQSETAAEFAPVCVCYVLREDKYNRKSVRP